MHDIVRNVAFAIAMLVSVSGTTEAQSDSVLTRVLSDSTSLLGTLITDQSTLPGRRPQIGATRLAAASGGFMFGILLGGFSGHELESQGCTNCRHRTTDALLLGSAIGGALGAALGAAFLELRSVCTFDRRVARALIGSGLGAAALIAVTGGLDKGGRSAFFVPIGAVGGALGTLGRCWKSRY